MFSLNQMNLGLWLLRLCQSWGKGINRFPARGIEWQRMGDKGGLVELVMVMTVVWINSCFAREVSTKVRITDTFPHGE